MTAKTWVRRFRRDRRPAELLEILSARLRDVANSTERDFLNVGGQLERIMSRARDEAKSIADVLDTTREQCQPAIIRALDQLRSWARREADRTRTETLLAVLQPIVEAAHNPLNALEETVRQLRVLGYTTRIECAWLGDRACGFEALAEEMTSLRLGIEEKSAALAEARHALSDLLARARRTAAVEEQAQHDQLIRLTAESAAGLEQIREEGQRVSVASSQVRGGYEKIAGDVAEMVASLQCHDNFRQRIEHVVGNLSQVTNLQTSDARIVQLQQAQLRNARSALVDSVNDIRTRLSGICDTLGDYLRLSSEIAGAGRMQATDPRIASVIETIAKLTDSRRILSLAAAEVQSACIRMSGFIADIENLGERLIRLGLNAEIRAVQLDRCGAVMETVATHIRRIAQQASESAKATGAALRELAGPARTLADALNEDSARTADDPGQMAAALHRIAADSQAADAENRRALAAIASGAETLSRDVRAILSGISADHLAEDAVSASLDTLDHIAIYLDSAGQAQRRTIDSGMIEKAAAIYTMHAERQAHCDFEGTATCTEPIASQAGSEFGANVELF